MAWNPSPEVAVARDAAKRLGNAKQCIVLWVSEDGTQLGYASYGQTKALCADAKRLGETAYKAVYNAIVEG